MTDQTPDLSFFLAVGTLPVMPGVEVPDDGVEVCGQGIDLTPLGTAAGWADAVGVCVGLGLKAFIALKRFQQLYPHHTRLAAVVGTTSDGRRVLLRVVATDDAEAPGKWVEFIVLDEPDDPFAV